MHFPDDENGDVLRRMQEHGDDLSLPRNVEFTVVFSDQVSAGKFASYMNASGHAASIHFADNSEQFPWDVVVTRHMTPTHQDIGEFESFLEAQASVYDGQNDGWGSLSQP